MSLGLNESLSINAVIASLESSRLGIGTREYLALIYQSEDLCTKASVTRYIESDAKLASIFKIMFFEKEYLPHPGVIYNLNVYIKLFQTSRAMTFLALLPRYVETWINKVSSLRSYKVLLGPNT